MGTKENPSKFDCYSNAKPDEPMFVLLGRDPCAWILVMAWCWMREKNGESREVLDEARVAAESLREYAEKLGKGDMVDLYEALFAQLFLFREIALEKDPLAGLLELPPMYQCPCGLDHREHSLWPIVRKQVERMGATIPSTVNGYTYQVPRIYVAFHGIKRGDIPRLTEQFGWLYTKAGEL